MFPSMLIGVSICFHSSKRPLEQSACHQSHKDSRARFRKSMMNSLQLLPFQTSLFPDLPSTVMFLRLNTFAKKAEHVQKLSSANIWFRSGQHVFYLIFIAPSFLQNANSSNGCQIFSEKSSPKDRSQDRKLLFKISSLLEKVRRFFCCCT